jgi:hypothetical protein
MRLADQDIILGELAREGKILARKRPGLRAGSGSGNEEDRGNNQIACGYISRMT